MTHPMFIHEDGTTCIPDESGTWFTPLDAGGEGVDCARHPEVKLRDALNLAVSTIDILIAALKGTDR